MFPRMIARMKRKFNRDVGIAQPDAASQPRLRFQSPRVVQLIAFLIVRLGQRGAAFAHVHMAGGTRRDHLAGMLDGDTGFEQTFAERSAALDFKVAAFRAKVRMRQQVDKRHMTLRVLPMNRFDSGQAVHGLPGKRLADGGVHAPCGKFIGDRPKRGR